MTQPITTAMKAAHIHALATLYFEDGQTERSLVLLMFASLLMPGDSRILKSLAVVALATGAAARALKIIELLQTSGAVEAGDVEILHKRARRLAQGRAESAGVRVQE